MGRCQPLRLRRIKKKRPPKEPLAQSINPKDLVEGDDKDHATADFHNLTNEGGSTVNGD